MPDRIFVLGLTGLTAANRASMTTCIDLPEQTRTGELARPMLPSEKAISYRFLSITCWPI